MILSVSRRTDIPAFYTKWFFNRLKDGYVLVRNPMNYHQVSKVILTPNVIDCIVFWTKDPSRILKKLDLLTDYNYLFQITITPYDSRIEPGVPAKIAVIKAFKQLADKIGKEKMIWRYDPIIVTDEMDTEYHLRQFKLFAHELHGYTESCIISFLDLYKKTKLNMKEISLSKIDERLMFEISSKFSAIAYKYDLKLTSCSETVDLSSVGIEHASCIDNHLISRIIGRNLQIEKDKNQRDICGCATSIDIGAYNTCNHGCLYCYANFNHKTAKANLLKHNPNSPMLIGNLDPDDIVTDRKIKTYQSSLFDMNNSD